LPNDAESSCVNSGRAYGKLAYLWLANHYFAHDSSGLWYASSGFATVSIRQGHVKSLANVRCTHRQVNPRRRSQSKHCSPPLQHTQQTLSVEASNPSETSTRHPRGSTTANLPLGAVPANSTATSLPWLPTYALGFTLRALSRWPATISRFFRRLFRQKSSANGYVMLLTKFSPRSPLDSNASTSCSASARLRRCC
jgi:hypothetical protein